MIFGRNHQLLTELNQKIDELSKEVQTLKINEKELVRDRSSLMEYIQNSFAKLEEAEADRTKQLRRQSAAFEDLMDELQEQQGERELLAKQMADMEQKETALLSLSILEKKQFELVASTIQNDTKLTGENKTAWEKQFSLMETERKKVMDLCGIQETGMVGEAVDYSSQEILKVIDTDEKRLDGTIAQVYSRGTIYSGRLLQKAKIAVYKYVKSEDSRL